MLLRLQISELMAAKIPRQPHRYSGRTAINANINVNEPMPPQDKDSPLAFSMEGYEGQPPSSLLSSVLVAEMEFRSIGK